jgi:hypothetical protein
VVVGDLPEARELLHQDRVDVGDLMDQQVGALGLSGYALVPRRVSGDHHGLAVVLDLVAERRLDQLAVLDIERTDGHAILLVDDARAHVVGIEGDPGRRQLFVGEANADVSIGVQIWPRIGVQF